MKRRGLEVLERADSRELVELARVKARLGDLASVGDAELEALIGTVTDRFENLTDREFAFQRYRQTEEARGGVVVLERVPLEPDSVSVTVDGVAPSDFDLRTEVAVVEVAAADGAEVVVTYRAGWLVPGVVSTWADATVYSAGAWVRPTKPSLSPLLFRATVGGESDATEPTWPEAGETVSDGGVTWEGREVEELPEDLSDLAIVGVRELVDALPRGLASMREEGWAESYNEGATGDIFSAALLRGLARWRL